MCLADTFTTSGCGGPPAREGSTACRSTAGGGVTVPRSFCNRTSRTRDSTSLRSKARVPAATIQISSQFRMNLQYCAEDSKMCQENSKIRQKCAELEL